MRKHLDFWLSDYRLYRRMIGGKWYLNAYRWDWQIIEVWEQKQFKSEGWPRTLGGEAYGNESWTTNH